MTYKKLTPYYVEFADGRRMIQLANNKAHAKVNALVTMGLRQKITVLRRATKEDTANARNANRQSEVQP